MASSLSRNPLLAKGGTPVDTSSQTVLFADQLAEIADLLQKKDEAITTALSPVAAFADIGIMYAHDTKPA